MRIFDEVSWNFQTRKHMCFYCKKRPCQPKLGSPQTCDVCDARWKDSRPGRCPLCGYNWPKTIPEEVCPECGKAVMEPIHDL